MFHRTWVQALVPWYYRLRFWNIERPLGRLGVRGRHGYYYLGARVDTVGRGETESVPLAELGVRVRRLLETPNTHGSLGIVAEERGCGICLSALEGGAHLCLFLSSPEELESAIKPFFDEMGIAPSLENLNHRWPHAVQYAAYDLLGNAEAVTAIVQRILRELYGMPEAGTVRLLTMED
ncbi:MAG: hypothetical protein HYV27_22635 [Candidatus Hydrogenedentes bacterium]|nr:hypothetical protein [Candidatus Hydrogenedentota bacterium]